MKNLIVLSALLGCACMAETTERQPVSVSHDASAQTLRVRLGKEAAVLLDGRYSGSFPGHADPEASVPVHRAAYLVNDDHYWLSVATESPTTDLVLSPVSQPERVLVTIDATLYELCPPTRGGAEWVSCPS